MHGIRAVNVHDVDLKLVLALALARLGKLLGDPILVHRWFRKILADVAHAAQPDGGATIAAE